MSIRFNRWTVGLALGALAAIAGASVMLGGGFGASAPSVGGAPPAAAGGGGNMEQQLRTYIVVYREAPLATYRGEIRGLAAPERLPADGAPQMARAQATAAGEGRVNVHSASARAYLSHLDGAQRQHEASITAAIGRAPQVERRMRHALNAVVTELSEAEAARVQRLSEVQFVEEYREYEQDTDVGPGLIGAPPLWNAATNPVKGEGIVFGILDSGINFGSPSFAAQDETGYTHTNPLGAGVYLGTCAAGGVDEGRCNAKLIGGYDFVCGAPGNTCGAANIREEPGFGDTNSHGSHTASTSAGNVRTVLFKGRNTQISGVAPRANIIAYDVCYTNTATGRGLCPNTSSAAAVDQAIADGIVDVINFSIGGGENPWSDSVSLAFLNAVNAGIYVATSAGNSGPGPNTMGHLEPWTASTAAAQHGRQDFGPVLQVTGPGTVPAALQTIMMNEGTGAVPFVSPMANTTPLKLSPGIDSGDDGCAAYPAGTFTGAIAVIRRGTCSFVIKGNNAAAAGAVAVVIANNAAGGLVPTLTGVTIPGFAMLQADANAVRDFLAGNPGTAGITVLPIPNTPDVLADFSSRGPAGTYDLLKPDVAAPGVAVLAVVAGTSISGSEGAVGLMNGTSMASPHHAGAAGLMRQAQPTWTVPEVKSALVMTAEQVMFKEDSVTPATPFDRGGGRLRVDLAVRAGLVLNETRANYLAANPATGGDAANLNQPSLAKARCVERCVFTRTFRNTLSVRQGWTVKLNGLSGTISPALFTLNPGESKAVKITVNSYQLPADGSWNFGTLVLTPTSIGTLDQPTLRLPVAVSVPPPVIALNPAQIAATLPAGGSGFANFRIDNLGGSRLDYTIDNTGQGSRTLLDAPRGAVSSGFRATIYSDPATAGSAAQFSADDFTLTEATRIVSLYTEGFVSSGQPLATTATSLTWTLYRDSGGNPEGNPQASPGLAVWSYTAAPTGAGVTLTGANIGLNLTAAGQNVDLPAGRYWLVVNARSSFANRWVWFASNTGDNVFRTITVTTAGAGAWTAGTGFQGLAWNVGATNACGAPWIGAPVSAIGRVNPGAVGNNAQVQLNAGGLSAGTHVGFICVASNDPVKPKVAARVVLTVTP
ncbi:S8 family serine peptidase [Lysobacter silvisoli]|uniref:Protease domain-containing protein n=1 Tax=Lysobacter silvisoli TaxID=2293254 RepID=A0A371K282_9GAMM|nr:S8 family serine peptidase [Lysobacter silvisoli]RDZ27980.1 protease domain-containing protein [Lysobacter silvisoli]